MDMFPVGNLLTPEGLEPPALRALIPDANNYSVLLMQPTGSVEASSTGVRNLDRELAKEQFQGFLTEALRTSADLAITPEYSMPWECLVSAIREKRTPIEGSLWALGCESITYVDLVALKSDLAPHASMLFESMPPDPQRFLDPLVYVFRTRSTVPPGGEKIVLLVQFKTCPMSDAAHFERNGLQKGKRIYQFGPPQNGIRLFSLICSDAFDFLDEHALASYDRSLMLHIQLNEKPRQDQYRQYRTRFFSYKGDETELICLNWAKGVQEHCNATARHWSHVSASAWYLRPDTFDNQDAPLCTNHRLGLYYTWLPTLRSNVMFFNYQPAIFLLTATKVTHVGVIASLSRRRGPQVSETRVWNSQGHAWIPQATTEDGFDSIVSECGNAMNDIKRIADNNPFDAERVLALSGGGIGAEMQWHELRYLDSCGIESNEVIRRMTFCQDTDVAASDFRVARLRRCAFLWNILTTKETLPPAIADLESGFRLDWNSAAPHQNVISAAGRRATAIYMGEGMADSRIEAVAKIVAENLNRSFPDPGASIRARQRLHVWSRGADGQSRIFDPSRYLNFDDPKSGSEYDITRTK